MRLVYVDRTPFQKTYGCDKTYIIYFWHIENEKGWNDFEFEAGMGFHISTNPVIGVEFIGVI